MRLIYNSDAQRLQKNFDDKTPVTVSELFRSERTASVPIELFLVDNDGGYATPGSSDYEVLIGRQAQAVTTGKLTLTFTGTTEEIDLSKPKLATRIEAALNAVSEVNAAGGVDVVELKNGRAFQITFRSVGSRAAITAGVKDSMQPASVLISEVTAGTGSTREVQLLTLEEASLAEVSTSGWSTNSNPALTITTLVEGTANTREVVQLSVSNDPAPGSFFVVSNSEPISTEATAEQVKTILNSALSNDIGSVKKTGERIWQITYKTNGDKTALSAGTHNLVKRPSVNATLSLNTTALAYAANSDGSDLSVGFTLKKSNEVLLSENVDLAEPFAEVIGSSAMLNNDSLGALFTIAGDDVNKGTAISLSGGLTYSSDTLAAPFLPLAGGTMTGDAVFNDGVKAIFGTSSDGLEIYHDGNSYIDDSGTGDLILRANDQLKIQGYSNSHNMAVFNKAGSVDIYYNNSKKFETTDTGATISGKLIVNGDLDVSGLTTQFESTVVSVQDPVFTVGGDTAPVASDNKDRGIEFRYFRSGESAKVGFFGYSNADDAFKLLTSATNNSEVFSGTLADLKCGNILLADDKKINFGDSSEYRIDYDSSGYAYHQNTSGATYFVNSANDKDFIFQTTSSDTTATILRLDASSGFVSIGPNTPNYYLSVKSEGADIELYDQDSVGNARLFIRAGGTSGNSQIFFGDDADVDIGKIRYRHSSNSLAFETNGTEAARFDSSGDFITVNNIKIPDSKYLYFGDSSDLQIYHNGFHSSIDNYTSDLYIRNRVNGGKDIIFLAKNSSDVLTELLRLDGSASSINVPDEIEMFFGSSNDFSIKHGPNNTHQKNFTGDFYISNDAANKDLIFRASNGTLNELMRLDGSTGNVGIGGVTSPATKLVIDNGGIGTVDSGYSLAILGDGIDGVQIISSSSNQGRIVFGDNSSNAIGRLNYDHSNDSMSFVTNGSEAMRIDSSQRCGIGLTNPTAKLEIKQTAATRGLQVIRNEAQANTEALVYFTDENTASTQPTVRIRNDGSGDALQVIDGNNPAFIVDGSGDITQNYINYTDGSNYEALKISAESDHIKYDTTSIGSFASNVRDHRFYVNGTQRFYVTNSGAWTTGNFYINGSGALRQASDHLYLSTSTQTDNDIIFKPANTEAVRITDTGRLGVGTGSTVDQLLHIKDDSVSNGLVRLRVQSGSFAGHADFGIQSGYARIFANSTLSYATSGTTHYFYTSGGSTITQTINGNGVAIGTTTPLANADLTLENGALAIKETTTPTADTDYGKIYCKSDNKLYFQDGAGTEHEIAFV